MNTLMSRRAFAAAGILAVLGVGLNSAGAQVADPRRPAIDTSAPKEVADGVCVVRDHRSWLVPNIGIVVGKDAALPAHTDPHGRRGRTLRRAGKSADDIHRVAKPEIVSAYPGWSHPDPIGWEINYSAAQPG